MSIETIAILLVWFFVVSPIVAILVALCIAWVSVH